MVSNTRQDGTVDGLKSEGGWSLEIIDTDYPFFGNGNWQASESFEGGTPGRINSVSGVNRDNTFSGIENVFPDDSITVKIRFSETNHRAGHEILKALK